MSKAVKKQVLCIAPCYFAQSGSKDLRQRQAARARRSQSTLGRRRASACTPRRSKRADPARRQGWGEQPRIGVCKKKKKSQWWCLRLSSDSQKRAGGGKRRRARGLTGRHGKANCDVVPLTLLHIELDLPILIWLYFKQSLTPLTVVFTSKLDSPLGPNCWGHQVQKVNIKAKFYIILFVMINALICFK